MKNLILSTTAIVMLSSSAAFALTNLDTNTIVAQYSNAQSVDIKRGLFRTTVTVVMDGRQIEVVYNNTTFNEVDRRETILQAAPVTDPAANLFGGGLVGGVYDDNGNLLDADAAQNAYGANNFGDDDDDDDDDDDRGRRSSNRNNNSSYSDHDDNDHNDRYDDGDDDHNDRYDDDDDDHNDRDDDDDDD